MTDKAFNAEQCGQTFGEEKGLVERQDYINIAILVTIALVIGVYLIATTVLIADDGAFYVEQARNFSDNPVGIMKKSLPGGYPILIIAAHRLITLFNSNTSAFVWIYCTQSLSLLCRMMSLIPLYFIGKLLVGYRYTFWGLLILIILPYPAELGSDAVREWPHILFLSTGLLFLILACRKGRWWMFVIAGLMAGLGQIIREEGAQVMLYGILWLSISLFFTNYKVSRLKTVCFILVLIAGFAIPTLSCVRIKGDILPLKVKTLIKKAAFSQPQKGGDSYDIIKRPKHQDSSVPVDILNAFGKLASRISENLMHFFVLPLAIGLYLNLLKQRKKILFDGRFFIIALLVLYLMMMLLLYTNYGYLSRRHCMPMIVFTSFYIPVGLTAIASWMGKSNRKGIQYYYILLLIGIAICLPKLVRPIRIEKQSYREVAEWLNKNTAPTVGIAVPDKRITLYAERKGLRYDKKVPTKADYIVRIVRNEDEKAEFCKNSVEEYSTWVDSNKSMKMVIYRPTSRGIPEGLTR